VFAMSYLYGMFTRIIIGVIIFCYHVGMFWKANVDLLIARSFVPLQIIKTSSRFNLFISWLAVSSNWLEFDPGFRTLSFKVTAYKVFYHICESSNMTVPYTNYFMFFVYWTIISFISSIINSLIGFFVLPLITCIE